MKEIIVLGMHRSATSLAAHSLSASNLVHMVEPDYTLLADKHNELGYFEDKRFIELNDSILQMAGGSWDKPPAQQDLIRLQRSGIKGLTNKIQLLIHSRREEAKKRNYKLWGWKDPRTTLTIRFYMPYLENPHFICCFRKSTDVANSLKKAHPKLTYEQAFTLHREYNKRLIEFLEEFNFPA